MNFNLTITPDTIATLLAAIVALLVYWLHRKDEKKKAAIILLSEIRDAEHSIGEVQRTGLVSDYTSILSGNHWKEYQYLFATTLDPDEIDLISNFYKSCEVIEQQVSLIKNYLPMATEHKVRLTQEKLLELADHFPNKVDFDTEKDRILDKSFWPNEAWFDPNAPKLKLVNYINGVQVVISSNAGSKLKRIAKSAWWKLFI